MTAEVRESVENATHTLHIMGLDGDFRCQWNTDNPGEIEIARTAFNEAKAKGMVAHTVVSEAGGTRTGEIVRDFDPEAGTLVMRPQMQGG